MRDQTHKSTEKPAQQAAQPSNAGGAGTRVPTSVHQMMRLQKAVGNRAVLQLLAAQRQQRAGSVPPVQMARTKQSVTAAKKQAGNAPKPNKKFKRKQNLSRIGNSLISIKRVRLGKRYSVAQEAMLSYLKEVIYQEIRKDGAGFQRGGLLNGETEDQLRKRVEKLYKKMEVKVETHMKPVIQEQWQELYDPSQDAPGTLNLTSNPSAQAELQDPFNQQFVQPFNDEIERLYHQQINPLFQTTVSEAEEKGEDGNERSDRFYRTYETDNAKYVSNEMQGWTIWVDASNGAKPELKPPNTPGTVQATTKMLTLKLQEEMEVEFSSVTGKRYKVVFPFDRISEINEANLYQFAEIEKEVQIPDGINPYGRFDVKSGAAVVVTDPTVYAEISNKLTEIKKNPTYAAVPFDLLDDPSKLPSGCELDHAGPGYEVYRATGTGKRVDLSHLNLLKASLLPLKQDAADTGTKSGRANKSTIDDWSGSKRSKSQTSVMGMSPNGAAHQIGLDVKSTSWEWLHLIAHKFGGGNDNPQTEDNMVLGTSEANTRMLEFEESVSALLQDKPYMTAAFEVKKVPFSSSSIKWLAEKIVYTVEVMDTRTKAVKQFVSQEFDPFDALKPSLVGLISSKASAKHFH